MPTTATSTRPAITRGCRSIGRATIWRQGCGRATCEGLRRWLAGAALLGGLAVAFDFTVGYIDVVNFGFAAFSGAGGYTSALLAIHLGAPPLVTTFGGMLAGGLLGFCTGALTLRFRGIYAAVVAWFLGLVLMG